MLAGKQFEYVFDIGAVVELGQLGFDLEGEQAFPHGLVQFGKETVLPVVFEVQPGAGCQLHAQVAEERQPADHCEGLLDVGTSDLLILEFHLEGGSNLLEKGDPVEQLAPTVDEVEEVDIFIAQVGGVRH
jgi:hypothetical protein